MHLKIWNIIAKLDDCFYIKLVSYVCRCKNNLKMNIKPIKTVKDYEQAMKSLDIIFGAKKGTEEGDELELLGMLVDNYENENFPIGFPDPVEAIKFRMEQMGYTQSDLANVVGLKSTASEILNRKRKLSLEMIRQIHDRLNIPTEVLIQAY